MLSLLYHELVTLMLLLRDIIVSAAWVLFVADERMEEGGIGTEMEMEMGI